ncbi:hypothetical protein [Aeromicrobium sp. UC242_57]|uniref:hypothetical protein n=1 Tax=Aeromicrobium sp. UC242_57 TaxID=3374624 RepID=UPI0037BCCBE4
MGRLHHSSAHDHAAWAVLIYQTATHETQQQILQRFAMEPHAEVTMLGTSRGPDHFVVVNCPGPQEQALVASVVSSVDRSALLVHVSRGLEASLG